MKAAKSGVRDAERWYRGANVQMRVIRRFAREVAERFHPEKIILFGSYAYGEPHADSDVDILVVMPARNEMDQAVKISLGVDAPFPMDHGPHRAHAQKLDVAPRGGGLVSAGDCGQRQGSL